MGRIINAENKAADNVPMIPVLVRVKEEVDLAVPFVIASKVFLFLKNLSSNKKAIEITVNNIESSDAVDVSPFIFDE
jgi:hypothetical protein